jgi:hypothetical protein
MANLIELICDINILSEHPLSYRGFYCLMYIGQQKVYLHLRTIKSIWSVQQALVKHMTRFYQMILIWSTWRWIKVILAQQWFKRAETLRVMTK